MWHFLYRHYRIRSGIFFGNPEYHHSAGSGTGRFIVWLCDACDILRGCAGLQSLALSATLMAM
jgi:hypothetical protein